MAAGRAMIRDTISKTKEGTSRTSGAEIQDRVSVTMAVIRGSRATREAHGTVETRAVMASNPARDMASRVRMGDTAHPSNGKVHHRATTGATVRARMEDTAAASTIMALSNTGAVRKISSGTATRADNSQIMRILRLANRNSAETAAIIMKILALNMITVSKMGTG